MSFTIKEQRNILNKKVREGKLTLEGKEARLNFTKDIDVVIRALDRFFDRQQTQLSNHEISALEDFKGRLNRIREE